MTEILFLDGTCGEGPGSYDSGVFHLPDGSVRGVEDLEDATSASGPETIPRRSGIARGLRHALAATGPLPRPLGLAASVLELGLDVLGGDGRPGLRVELRFTDGATASIRSDAEEAARIVRDRAVVRQALLRRAESPGPDATVAVEETQAAEASGAPTPAAPPLASIFAYEKRGGRLRRLADKARDDA